MRPVASASATVAPCTPLRRTVNVSSASSSVSSMIGIEIVFVVSPPGSNRSVASGPGAVMPGATVANGQRPDTGG